MANELFAVGGLAPEARAWYEKQLLGRAVPQFVYMKYAKQKSIPANGGINTQFRRFERITTSTTVLTEGTPPSATNGTFTQVVFTVGQYGQYANLSDVAIKQSQDDLLAEYSQNFGEAAGDAIDQLERDAIIAGATSIQYASTGTSAATVGSGMYLTPAEIREAVRTLSRNNAPKVASVGRYVCITHPDARFDFMGTTDAVNAYQYAAPRTQTENPLFTGELFDWMGVRFEVTTQVKVNSSAGLSGADIYNSIVFGQDAFAAVKFDTLGMALIVKPLGSAGTADPLSQIASVGWKASWAGGVLDVTRVVNIKHVTSIKNAA